MGNLLEETYADFNKKSKEEKEKLLADINKMFEEDFKLKHLKLENVQYFDDEKERFFDVNMELFGHCELINLQDGRSIKNFQNKNNELEYKVIEADTINITVKLASDKIIKMPYKNLDALEAFYLGINAPFEKLREEFRDNVILLIPELLKNDQLRTMALNFIDNMQPIFPRMDFIIGFEWILENLFQGQGKIGRLLFLSCQYMRDLWSKNDGKKSEIIQILSDDFPMFVKVVGEKLDDKDGGKSIYCTYLFLYNMAIEYYSKKWVDEYGNDFTDINSLDLDSVIGRYCSIDAIKHGDSITKGEFVYYLIYNNKFEGNRNFIECLASFSDLLEKHLENKKYQNFVKKISNTSTAKKKYSINDIDIMTGQEFEQFVALLFSKLGYETEITKTSGDQGIDVIASKNGTKIGLQAKCYSGTVGNNAIQEAVAGKNYYRLDKSMVITNNFFTESAQQLANANSVVLWDRNILKEKIIEIFNS